MTSRWPALLLLLAATLYGSPRSLARAEEPPPPPPPTQRANLDPRCVLTATRVRLGEPFEAAFTVTNQGVAATVARLEVTVPEGLKLLDGTTLPVDLGTIAPGASRAKRLRFSASAVGALTLAWAVVSSDGTRVEGGSPVDVAAEGLSLLCAAEPATVTAGSEFDLRVTVSNASGDTARNLVIAVAWPEGVKPRTQTITTLPELPAGRRDQFFFRGLAQGSGRLPVKATVAADGVPEVASSCAVEVTSAPARPLRAILTPQDLSKRFRGSFRVGEEFLYALEVVSDTGTPAPLRASVTLPPQVEFVSAASDAGVAVTAAGRTLTTGDIRLAAGQRTTFELRVRAASAPQGGRVEVAATLHRAGDAGDAVPLAAASASHEIR